MNRNEHAPLIGSRRAQGAWLCHRRECECDAHDGKGKRAERRTMKKVERATFRRDVVAGRY